MYEDIDIDDAPESAEISKTRRNRAGIGFVILFGLALLVAAALFTRQVTLEPDVDEGAREAERVEYRAALTERAQAVRRARLTDFIATYPESENLTAAKAQLEVLTSQEQADWAALSFVLFDTDATRLDKLSALETYKRTWNVALLGGRNAEVAKIEAELAKDETDLPSRELEIDPDAFPDAVDRDTLVGGDFDVEGTYIPPSVIDPVENDLSEDVVIRAPRLRRNARPRYPRRAERDGIEAVVVLELYINAGGRVEDTTLVSVDAPRYKRDFVRASERAAHRLRFYPRTINGTPVPTEGVEKRFRFSFD